MNNSLQRMCSHVMQFHNDTYLANSCVRRSMRFPKMDLILHSTNLSIRSINRTHTLTHTHTDKKIDSLSLYRPHSISCSFPFFHLSCINIRKSLRYQTLLKMKNILRFDLLLYLLNKGIENCISIQPSFR